MTGSMKDRLPFEAVLIGIERRQAEALTQLFEADVGAKFEIAASRAAREADHREALLVDQAREAGAAFEDAMASIGRVVGAAEEEVASAMRKLEKAVLEGPAVKAR